ncbi:hypothetical protein Sar04_12490 [Salinispora arenicola]|uniref:Phosphotransferase family enzyme n=1 Tax=Salinispora arenicola TaxID=168697 RepID=A0A542XKX3_SALAC|nr:phosphotransferase family enzyme [Salinispora arenicola]GIM83490.1 hypothetical protein Sar04_12490 [Salinispora arenicola]
MRITRSTTLHDRVHKVARLATWFAERNAPTIRLAAHVDRSQDSLVHGDAHVGNLLRTSNGDVVIGDFDPTCTAPWQVDLVAVPVGETRFGRHGAHARLALAYGYDVTQDPDWPTLREARELTMVCAAVPLLASAPGIAGEFRTRLHSIRAEDHQAVGLSSLTFEGRAQRRPARTIGHLVNDLPASHRPTATSPLAEGGDQRGARSMGNCTSVSSSAGLTV